MNLEIEIELKITFLECVPIDEWVPTMIGFVEIQGRKLKPLFAP